MASNDFSSVFGSGDGVILNHGSRAGLANGGGRNPSFQARRTDADRRPAKSVIFPNDYAPSMAEREAESARRLAAINAKRLEAQRIFVERRNAPKTHLRESDMANAERTREAGIQTEIRVLRAINSGCSILRDLGAQSQTSEGNARRVVRKLEARGFVIIDLELVPENTNGTMRHRYLITQVGKQYLKDHG